MVGMLAALVLLVLLVLLLRWVWAVQQSPVPGSPAPALTERDRARRAAAIADARWSTAHDEVDGTTRVLLRRSCPGPDGRPEVLEERVFETFPARDPAWEVRFTEAMANARYRCGYLNAEEER